MKHTPQSDKKSVENWEAFIEHPSNYIDYSEMDTSEGYPVIVDVPKIKSFILNLLTKQKRDFIEMIGESEVLTDEEIDDLQNDGHLLRFAEHRLSIRNLFRAELRDKLSVKKEV